MIEAGSLVPKVTLAKRPDQESHNPSGYFNMLRYHLTVLLNESVARIRVDLPNRVYDIAERANLVPQLCYFIYTLHEFRTTISSFMDTLKITYTAALAEQYATTHPGAYRNEYHLPFMSTLRIQMGWHRHLDELEAIAADSTLTNERTFIAINNARAAYNTSAVAYVRQVIGTLEQRSAMATEHTERVLYISEETIVDQENLSLNILRALENQYAIVVRPQKSGNADLIRSAVDAVLERLCPDFSERMVVLDHNNFTPYGIITNRFHDGVLDLAQDHAELIKGYIASAFHRLRYFSEALFQTFDTILKSRELRKGEKRYLVGNLLIAVGLPKDQIRQFFKNIREVRLAKGDYSSICIVPMLETIATTASFLESVSPQSARRFVNMVIDIACGTIPGAAAALRETLESLDISTVFVKDEGLKALIHEVFPLGFICTLIGIPNPITETGEFLMHLADRIREAWKLTSFNIIIGVTTLVYTLIQSGGDLGFAWANGLRNFLYFEKLVPLLLLASMYPRFGSIPFSWGLEDLLNLIEKVPWKLAQDVAEGFKTYYPFTEGTGIGPRSVNFNQWERKRFQLWKTASGFTYVLAYGEKMTQPFWTEPGRFQITSSEVPAGHGLWGQMTYGFEIRDDVAGSHIPRAFLHSHAPIPILTAAWNRWLERFNNLYRQRVAVIPELWRWPRELGTATAPLGTPSRKDYLVAGILEFLFSLGAPIFPKFLLYSPQDVIPLQRLALQPEVNEKLIAMKAVRKRDPYLHTINGADLQDAMNCLIGMIINLEFFNIIGVLDKLPQISASLAHPFSNPWYNVGLNFLLVGLPQALHLATEALIDPRTFSNFAYVMTWFRETTGWGIFNVQQGMAGGQVIQEDPSGYVLPPGETCLLDSGGNLMKPDPWGQITIGPNSNILHAIEKKYPIITDAFEKTGNVRSALQNIGLRAICYEPNASGGQDLVAQLITPGTTTPMQVTIQTNFIEP